MNKLSKEGVTLSVDLLYTFASFDTLSYWVDRQIYRIISIWVVLSGNVIEYVNHHGFFYGLTYIKFLASWGGFPYISLPLISAEIIGASYAQPGAVAEGYANFGIIGGAINCFVIFLMAELYLDLYLRKRTILSMLFLFVVFCQVLIDGGTANSVLFLTILGYMSFNSYKIFKTKK